MTISKAGLSPQIAAGMPAADLKRTGTMHEPIQMLLAPENDSQRLLLGVVDSPVLG